MIYSQAATEQVLAADSLPAMYSSFGVARDKEPLKSGGRPLRRMFTGKHMTNWREIDFRHDWISLTLKALKSGFEVIDKTGEEVEWFDGLWQLEHAESIFGMAFIAAQSYILGTVGDLNKIRASNGKSALKKRAYYSDDLVYLQNGVSRISFINEIANYYKHHDEWDGWPKRDTTEVLAKVGIDESTDFPCYEAAKRLLDEKEDQNLENLLSIISEWRKYVLSKYQ